MLNRFRKGKFALAFMLSIFVPGLAWADFANFKGCVYEEKTGKPISGAQIWVQFLGSANGGGEFTGLDGCTAGTSSVNTDYEFDYIEARYEQDGKQYRQQFHIPNRLIEGLYEYHFFLNLLPRRGVVVLGSQK